MSAPDWREMSVPERVAEDSFRRLRQAHGRARVKICDGYQNNGRSAQTRVRRHSRQLATTTVEATGSDCPLVMSFQNDSETVDRYATLSNSAVVDFLGPHLTH